MITLDFFFQNNVWKTSSLQQQKFQQEDSKLLKGILLVAVKLHEIAIKRFLSLVKIIKYFNRTGCHSTQGIS